MKTLWKWLSKSENQKTLAFVGSGIAAIVGGIWTVYVHLAPEKPSLPQQPQLNVGSGGIVAGGNLTVTAPSGGTAVVATGNVTIGITLDQHYMFLKRRETELRAELTKERTEDKAHLENQLIEVQQLRQRIVALEFKVPQPEKLADTNAASVEQDTSKAIALSGEIERKELLYYKDVTTTVLSNARRLIQRSIAGQERPLEQQVMLLVDPTPNVRGFARIQNGRPEIIITSGTVRVLEWLATVEVYATAYKAKSCLENYSKYLFERIADNSERYVDGKPRASFYVPYTYGRLFGGPCQGLPQKFTKDAGEQFAQSMDASMMFFYLHELGHLVLGHLENLTSRVELSENQEAESNAWALKTAYKAQFNLLTARPLINLMAGRGGNLEAERKWSHPLGIRRAVDLLKQARAIYALKKYPGLVELDRDIEQSIERYSQLIPQ